MSDARERDLDEDDRISYSHDPRRAVVRDIIERLNPPRAYAGDWPGDMAVRVLRAIDEIAERPPIKVCQSRKCRVLQDEVCPECAGNLSVTPDGKMVFCERNTFHCFKPPARLKYP